MYQLTHIEKSKIGAICTEEIKALAVSDLKDEFRPLTIDYLVNQIGYGEAKGVPLPRGIKAAIRDEMGTIGWYEHDRGKDRADREGVCRRIWLPKGISEVYKPRWEVDPNVFGETCRAAFIHGLI